RTRQLQRRHRYRALSNRHARRFTDPPWLAIQARLPFPGGHNSFFFMRQVDSALMAESDHVAVEGEIVDARFCTDGVEVNVAGVYDAAMQRLCPMHLVAMLVLV